MNEENIQQDDRFSPRVCFAILAGATAASWGAIAGIVMLATGTTPTEISKKVEGVVQSISHNNQTPPPPSGPA